MNFFLDCFPVFRTNEQLISTIVVLPFVCGVICYMLYSPLALQPQLVFARKTLYLTYETFLRPHLLSHSKHIVSLPASVVTIETCASHSQRDISCTQEKCLHIFPYTRIVDTKLLRWDSGVSVTLRPLWLCGNSSYHRVGRKPGLVFSKGPWSCKNRTPIQRELNGNFSH